MLITTSMNKQVFTVKIPAQSLLKRESPGIFLLFFCFQKQFLIRDRWRQFLPWCGSFLPDCSHDGHLPPVRKMLLLKRLCRAKKLQPFTMGTGLSDQS